MLRFRQHPSRCEPYDKDSVAQRSVDRYNCFLMTDQAAVEQAVNEGATRLIETDLENPF